MYIPPIHYSLSCPRPHTIPSDISTSFLLSSVDSPPPSIPLDDSSAPICLYSPHTHTYTNLKPRTAFFSVGRRLRVVHNPAHLQWKPFPPCTWSTASAPRSPCRHPQQPTTSPRMHIVCHGKKLKVFLVARQQLFKPPMTLQLHSQYRCAHPLPDFTNSPQPLTPALYPSLHALQLHQCLMEAILNCRSSDRHSSKQDDFSRNKGDPVIASVPIATSHKRSVTTESPITNAKSCSKGDVMSSEIVDIGSLPLTPKTPHTPVDFKTQVLHFPLLVCLLHCSTSCTEQCEVTFHCRLHSIPLKIKCQVQV